MSEAKLVRAAAGGSQAAFGSLVEKYQSLVCAITYSVTGQLQQSEELAQETFVRAWQNLNQLRDMDNFKGWIATIARNIASNYIRSQKRDVLKNAAPMEAGCDIATGGDEPSDKMITQEEQTMMREALEQLPQDYREVLILYYWEHRSTKEVAEQLGLDENNVRVRVHRGREMLRERVAQIIEKNLERSRPGKALTAAVMAAIGGLAAAVATSAAAAGEIGITSGSTTGTIGTTAATTTAAGTSGGTLMGTIGTYLATAAGIVIIGVAAVVGYNVYSNSSDAVPAVNTSQQVQAQSSDTQTSASSTGQIVNVPTEQADAGQNALAAQSSGSSAGDGAAIAYDPNTTVSIKVTVVDGNSKPIANSRVTLFRGTIARPRYKLDDVNERSTGSDGSVVFLSPKMKPVKKVVGRRVGYLLAEKTGKACGWSKWEPTQSQEVQITLAEPSIISGVIMDDSNKPVADATVSLKWVVPADGGDTGYLMAEKPFEAFACVSGQDGKFAFSMPENTRCEVFAEKPGMAKTMLMNEPGRAAHITSPESGLVLVLNPAACIEGKVVDMVTGAPLKGMPVMITGTKLDIKDEMPLTDENGQFKFDSLNEGTYSLSVSKSGNQAGQWFSEPIDVSIDKGKTAKDVLIRASNGGMVEIRVVDSRGKPVEKVSCEVVSKETGEADRPPHTDPNGIIRWSSKPGAYTIRSAVSPQFYKQCNIDFQLEAGKVAKAELSVEASATMIGIVKDPNGAATSNIKITLLPFNEEAVTDANGAFIVGYNASRWGTQGQKPIVIARDKRRNFAAAVQIVDANKVEVTLAAAVSVSGKIVDPNGKPVVGTVSASFIYGPTVETAATDRAGEYSLKLLPAGYKYTFTASAKDYGATRSSLEQEGFGTMKLETMVVKPAMSVAAGKVVDENDNPIAGIGIYFFGEGQPQMETVIITDAGGNFSFKACEGQVDIIAQKENLRSHTRVQAPCTDAKIVLIDNKPANYESIKGRQLPTLADYVSGIAPDSLSGKKLALMFFDMKQLPAEIAVGQTENQQFAQIKAMGIELIGVQVRANDQAEFDAWKQKFSVPFEIVNTKTGTTAIRAAFGVNQVPWIVLTDSKHVVQFEGVEGNELLSEMAKLQ